MYRILLAEDNPGDVLLFREALSAHKLPCELIIAEDGEKALKMLEKEGLGAPNPDLIVLDINLPKRSGQDVLFWVRGNHRYGTVPVMILTSSVSPDDRAKAEMFGADLYVAKSSNLDEIFEIGKIVEGMVQRRTE